MPVKEEQTKPTGRSGWLAAGSLGFIFLTVLFFIPVPKALQNGLGGIVLNSAHIGFFCCFSLIFFPFTKGKTATRTLRFLIIVLVLSFIIEGIQATVGRTFQLEDILRNLLGALLGLAILMSIKRPDSLKLWHSLLFIVAILSAVVVERMPLLEQIYLAL